MLILGGRSRLRLAVVFCVLAAASLVAGLAAGAAWNDFGSDRGHPAAERTYRVVLSSADGSLPPSTRTPRSLADQVRGASSAIRVSTSVVVHDIEFQAGDDGDRRNLSIAYVDGAFPEVFELGLNVRDLRQMEDRGAVRFTRAERGRQAAPEADREVLIEGVPRPLAPPLSIPRNSHLNVDLIAPMSLLPAAANEEREIAPGQVVRITRSNDAVTYVVVDDGQDQQAAADLRKLVEDTAGPGREVALQPLRNIRFEPAPAGDLKTAHFVTGRGQETYSALAIGGLAVLAAMTSVALLIRAMLEREGQVLGILRALGKTPRDLGLRLLAELSAVAALALLTSLLAAIWLGPPLFAALGSDLGLSEFMPVLLAMSGCALALVVAVACGFAWPLLARAPTALLTGARTSTASWFGFTSIAVGLQAALCFSVVFSALFIHGELERAVASTRDFREVWRVQLDGTPPSQARLGLESSPQVRNVILTGWAPYSELGSSGSVLVGGAGTSDVIPANFLVSDGDTLDLLPQPLLAGRRLTASDSASCRVLANESFVSRMGGLSADAAVGRTVRLATPQGLTSCTIAGVVGDVRLSARTPPEPSLSRVQRSADLAEASSSAFSPRFALVSADRTMTGGELQDLAGTGRQGSMPIKVLDLEKLAYERDRRLVGFLAAGSMLLFLMVSATLISAVALILEERATEIGILRALGYSWIQIAVRLVLPLWSVTLIGALAGLPIVVSLLFRWSKGLHQSVTINPGQLLLAILLVSLPLLLALLVNWGRMRSISPAAVLRSG